LKLLDIQHLSIRFDTDDGSFKAVDDVSFHINAGEIVGLVGESGCGKSVTALGILRLIPSPAGKFTGGKILFKGKDLLALSPKEMRKIRGHEIAIIFQEPTAALSPLHRIGDQLTEALLFHKDMSRKDAWRMAETWLEKMKISDAAERMFAYPHQLSGGMQQRVMIAMALMLEPALLIADEPTTALDVTVQAQIFDLIREMRQNDTAILLITHDMGAVWEICDRVIVMYASKIAEEGRVDELFSSPAHPYTKGLLSSIPKFDFGGGRLTAIAGYVPSPLNYPSGCHFQDRCAYAFERCRSEIPPLTEISPGRRAACFLCFT